MAKYRFYYILFAVVSTVLMFSYKSKLTSVLFLIAIAIPVISFVLLVFSRLLVKIRIEYRSLTAEKFENTDISVTVTNRFIIPLSPAELIGCFPYRNSEKFEYQKLVIYDLFKLFRMNKTMKCYEDFVVLPRKLVIDPIIDTGDGDSETISQNNFSLDKNAFASIREYRAEDSIKNVHWTMSAKHDKLMVKQMERSIGGSCVIIPDLNEYFPFDEDNYEATDSIIEVMLALDLSLISMKQRCLNAWYSPADKQCEQFSVKNEEDNMLLFDIISRLPRQTDTFLPETVARSCMEASADISAVYFVTSQLRRDFIGKMTDIELFRNKRVKILLVSGAIETDEQAELADAVAVTQGFELWKIDKDNIVQSLNAAIELHKKQ